MSKLDFNFLVLVQFFSQSSAVNTVPRFGQSVCPCKALQTLTGLGLHQRAPCFFRIPSWSPSTSISMICNTFLWMTSFHPVLDFPTDLVFEISL